MPIQKRFLTCLLTLLLATVLHAADLPEKHPLDNQESQTLVLENGLRVILVSDPDLNMASASMAINAGSYLDPADAPGLAHFLEHMLFLGTEKFPSEGEYTQYLSQNGGYSNAYTAGDHTNYHFQIFPHALEGALDRFSQFFIAPLFTAEFTERELNAIESEHAKNLEDDGWRGYLLFRRHTREDHPENRFTTGNKETLAEVRREELIDYYTRYYCASQMALSLVSTASLDQMESWVRTYFSEIKNHGAEPVRYPADFMEEADAVRVVKMQALKDRRQLSLYFEMPSIRNDWDAKTSQLLGGLFGYEGKGSLLSLLKRENLATQLGASLYEASVDHAVLGMTINLTPEGEAAYDRVLECVMSYAELLRQSAYPAYFFEEQAIMARLAALYTDKGEGADRAVDLANRALTLPLEMAEEAPYAFLRQDEPFYRELLGRISPKNMVALLSSKQISGESIEPIYGTAYTYLEIEGDLFERLDQPVLLKGLTLPQPNPFVPQNVQLLAENPVQLINEPALSLYYGQDHEFQRPKVAMSFRIRRPAMDYTLRDAVLLELYEAAVREYINEIAYDARMADLGYSVSAGLQGVQVSIFGYSESAARLLPVIIEALTDFELDEALYAATRERLVRGWNSARFDNGYMLIRHYTNMVSYKDAFMPWEKGEVAAGIELEEVIALRDSLFSTGRIESLIYGNVTATEAIGTARLVQAQLGLSAPEGELYEHELLVYEPGQSVVVKDVLPTNNSVFRKDFIVDQATPEMRAALGVLSNLLEAPYYSEMRTRQQLGYVVWSFSFEREDEMRLGFVIQSGEYDPVELVRRSDAMLAGFANLLQEMPEEAFAQAKAAVRSELEKKDKTIAEKASRFFRLAYEHGANWSRTEESLAALETLEMEDILNLVRAVNDPAVARAQQVLLFARQLEELAGQTDAVTDMKGWKQGRPVRQVTEL